MVQTAESEQRRILVVDDEKNMRFFLREALKSQGYTVLMAENGENALEMIKDNNGFDCVLLDIRMPRKDGLQTLDEILAMQLDIPVIMMTAYGSKEVAMEAIRMGAYDYFTKPFDINEMRVVVKRALEKQQLEGEIRRLRTELDEHSDVEGIVGNSKEMKQVYSLIHKVGKTDVTVIIYGESGTGKELVANVIRNSGQRKEGPFVKINCAAIPENLLESELFGYEKGAFTGASQRKIGKFEQADRGTIFLDEIGDMSLMTQAKVLRVLEEREFARLGGTESIKVDIRIIAATNQDLPRAVKEKLFREDLYFRLNIMPIYLPPLRARKGDIMLLTDYFLESANRELEKNVKGYSRSALSAMLSYDWPGNVRELENVVQRAVLLAPGETITDECLPANVLESAADGQNPGDEDFDGSLQEIVDNIAASAEKQIIIDALERTNWSRTKTAELLKICRKSLHNKMTKYGLFEVGKNGQ